MNYAFIGKMRAGKDTAADFMIASSGGHVLKFADPLYEMQKEIYRIARLPHPEGTKDRLLLQIIGTAWGRNTIDKNIWINVMDAKITEMSNTSNMYITDVRFPNEFDLLKKHNFVLVKINRPLEERIKFGATNLDHESETALDIVPDSEYDTILENDGSLDTFYKKTLDMARTTSTFR